MVFSLEVISKSVLKGVFLVDKGECRWKSKSFHCGGLDFDSSIPFVSFVFHTKTHLLQNKITTFSPNQKLILRVIFKLKSQGYDFKKISESLNQHKIRTYSGKNFNKNLVWNIYTKRVKRLKFLNQPVIREYKDFDILFKKIMSS